MLAPSFITRALCRAWQREHVLGGLHQPLACCFVQFSQMYQSSRPDPAIWTAFTASRANSQEMFNNVPCTSVAGSRSLEGRVAKRNPGSASLQLSVTCWVCCYCLRVYFCEGSHSLRFPKAGFKVSWTRPAGSWSRGWIPAVLLDLGMGPAGEPGEPSQQTEQGRAEFCSSPNTLLPIQKGSVVFGQSQSKYQYRQGA